MPAATRSISISTPTRAGRAICSIGCVATTLPLFDGNDRQGHATGLASVASADIGILAALPGAEN